LTNCTGYPSSAISGTISLTTQVTGTLPVANGGTGVTTSTGSGNVVLSTSPTLVTPILGTPTSGTLTNTTGFPAANLAGTALPAAIVTSSLTAVGTIATGVWNGTAIAIANGGTGQTTASAAFNALSPITTTGDLIIGNGTNSATRLAIGANTYVLTSNGTTASWQAAAGGGTQATATALGTAYARQTTGGGTPYLTAFGYNSAPSATGTGNTAMGTQALYSDTTGYANTAIGYQASYLNQTGSLNTFVGYQTGYTSNVSGAAGNTAVGYGAGYALTTGYYNCFFGVDGSIGGAGGSTTTGTNNAFYGGAAGFSNTTGSYNVAMGIQALQNNTTASYNTAVGYQASRNITTGTENTMLGPFAGSNATTGSYNVLVGTSSGGSLTTGGSNVIIGRTSGVSLVDGTNNIYIGYASYASGASSGSENVIGFNITGKGNSTSIIANPCYQGNNSATWSVTSDQRLKKNIVDNTIGLSAINQIQIRNFEYKTEDEITELPKHSVIKKEGVQLGVIAQELQAILPDCVKTESTGVMSVDSTDIMWHMINAIKELSAEVNALKAKVGA
jgi:hypothetical protein